MKVVPVDVVVPAYLEQETITAALLRLHGCLRDGGFRARIIVVVDGPGDDTATRARESYLPDLQVIELASNRGKGFAIRTGLRLVKAEFCAYIDGDLDLHPDSLAAGISLLRTARPSVACVAGSKHHPSSLIRYPWSRRVLSHLYRATVRRLLRLSVSDTQTGLKVFRSSAIHEIQDALTEDRFGFDLELLGLLLERGYDIWEIPVVLDYSFSTTVSPRSAGDAFIAVWRVRNKLRRGQRFS